ncbi:MAG TPA: gamma-glutamylcyclotransferase family protein [Burkholderiaceae bacterium]
MAHCFTYGSLMWADIMETVCGCAHVQLAAQLADHARHPLRGQDYPGMQPSVGSSVEGRLYLDVGEAALARLDAFEGEQYERTAVTVRLTDGRELPAWTYLFKTEFSDQLEAGEWNVQRFEREGKARFMAEYAGFGT